MVRVTIAIVAMAFGSGVFAQCLPMQTYAPQPARGLRCLRQARQAQCNYWYCCSNPWPVLPVQPAIAAAIVSDTPPEAQAPIDKLPGELRAHLLSYEMKSKTVKTLYTEVEREITNTLMKKTTKYVGAFRCMKPNLMYMRLDHQDKKEDFYAEIFDGKSSFEYQGLEKTVVEYRNEPDSERSRVKHLVPGEDAQQYLSHFFARFFAFSIMKNPVLNFLSTDFNADEFAAGYDLQLLKKDRYYIYIEAKPLRVQDQQIFDSLSFVLYNADVQGLNYLPAKMRLTRDNGQIIEEWTFKKLIPNAEGIKKSDFQYIEPPKDWKKKLLAKPSVDKPL